MLLEIALHFTMIKYKREKIEGRFLLSTSFTFHYD